MLRLVTLFFHFYFLCIGVLFAGISEGRATDRSEPLCVCWEFSQGPVEEQPVLFTAEQFLQPWQLRFFFK